VYLPFLGKLVELLKQEDVRKKLQQAETFKDFIDGFSGGSNG
jgi:mannitol/fructose-specific phosphotransferase system IIA component (Ntr-type)